MIRDLEAQLTDQHSSLHNRARHPPLDIGAFVARLARFEAGRDVPIGVKCGFG